jgi:predicted acetyltransferase
VNIAAPTTESHWDQFTAIEGQAFATPADDTAQYIAAVMGGAIARFAFADGRVAAGALAFPCKQYVGGRLVPAGAVASVCVAPEHRGKGLGRSVMWSLARAMADAGLALAPLWPSSVSFYRGMGWELAGHVSQFTVPAERLRGLEAAGTAVRDPALAEVRPLVASLAGRRCGPIERPEWWWKWRFPTPAKELSYRYGWREGDALTGFVAFRHHPPKDRPWGFDVWVTDFWAATSDALNGLAALVGADAPLSPHVRFHYGVLPDAPDLMWRLPDLDLITSDTNGWMLRVLDPAAALEQSGWPTGVTGRIEIDVAGIGQPSVPLSVEFADGRAHTSPSTTARVRMSTGAFAAWYAGSMTAQTAAMLGLASGSPDDLALMNALTADRRPWLPDMF